MVPRRLLLAFSFGLVSRLAAAQAYAPVVTMSVTLPDGRTEELVAPESGLATLPLKDGIAALRETVTEARSLHRGNMGISEVGTGSAAIDGRRVTDRG